VTSLPQYAIVGAGQPRGKDADMKFVATSETTLLELIQKKQGCSATKAKKIVKNSEIQIDGVVCTDPNPALDKGACVILEMKKTGPKTDIAILYEDADLIVVDKPVGIITSGVSSDIREVSLHKKLIAYIKSRSHGRGMAYVVHRLDQKVSGVLVFAKSQAICDTLIDEWRTYEKRYHAVVEGTPKEAQGTLQSWLREDANYKVYSTHESKDAKLAITHFEVLATARGMSLLDIRLETGRKNQIRVQLADAGCPIVGDVKYGAKTNPFKRIGLHSYTLSLIHPRSQQRMVFTSPTPHPLLLGTRRPEPI
jgi:23S rRNA pseudouridine1911/1915/1917 synthase